MKDIDNEGLRTARKIFSVIRVYKDADITEGMDEVIAQSKLENAELVKIKTILKFSDVQSFAEASKGEKQDLEISKDLYKMYLYNGALYFFVHKDIDSLIEDWEENNS